MPNDHTVASTKSIQHDNPVDAGIRDCLKLGSGKSFIIFAGAGSGKTFSLENALEHLKLAYQEVFSRLSQQVAVVTFTNNAADEIRDRVERNPIFSISTIHSFCWHAIDGFNADIRQWFLSEIPNELEKLKEQERRGRAGKASDARKRSIARLTEKMEWLANPQEFKYDPNGVNSAQNALAHADVLKIFAHFLTVKPMMAEVLANKYPFIFVDESQDTNKDVINALFTLQKTQFEKTVVGLFGDRMQRIFGGGEPELGKSLPSEWKEFDKQMNHRSARRIVGLGNTIRKEDDGRLQYARDGAAEGLVRFFLLPHGTSDKDQVERRIRNIMAKTTGDLAWNVPKTDQTAVLLLEHRMVSRRLGFTTLSDALSKSRTIKERLYEGDSLELNFFSNTVLPLVEAGQAEDIFETMKILRDNKSPLLHETVFSENELDPLLAARTAEGALRSTISNSDVSLRDVLAVIAEHNLLTIPSKLRSFVTIQNEVLPVIDLEFDNDTAVQETSETPSDDDEFDAWAAALETPFQQVQGYRDYSTGNSIYRTHQGVKGNEFERVMAIMDDDEAGGFNFSYEQYFGAKVPSAEILAKDKAGEETGLGRTRRLFYVTSTRAKRSLAHVIYTADVEQVQQNLLARKLATEGEILLFPFLLD
ncbi:ATP-dependent helicase [Roseobacter litoralis]|uniref:DNA 3'-5' helicase II n=1 Tax=Roseobacter litoralis (strain ATCC 49566 / DSM 6996 / JCM 21268 / NBRC 15278 / OCh 149) TaxID=391595 RepID=F7ZJM9_ROSLO|nr:ATP-dependent helicase [Roseobacter litoralis]AEI93860.1 DNA helicase-like protein [Roseobacter litoralis Och 149]